MRGVDEKQRFYLRSHSERILFSIQSLGWCLARISHVKFDKKSKKLRRASSPFELYHSTDSKVLLELANLRGAPPASRVQTVNRSAKCQWLFMTVTLDPVKLQKTIIAQNNENYLRNLNFYFLDKYIIMKIKILAWQFQYKWKYSRA